MTIGPLMVIGSYLALTGGFSMTVLCASLPVGCLVAAAGMVIAYFGRIPHAAEHFQWGAWRIEVVDLDGPRIDKLLLQRIADYTDERDDG